VVERFGLTHLFEDQIEGPSSPLYWVLGGLFLLLLFGSLYLYLQSGDRFAADRFHRRLARRFASLAGGFSGLGLAATVFTLLAVPFLSKRIWLLSALFGLLGMAVYGGVYFRRRYPAERARHEENERRRRYLPRPKHPGRRPRARRK
jgi:hypothetical protein